MSQGARAKEGVYVMAASERSDESLMSILRGTQKSVRESIARFGVETGAVPLMAQDSRRAIADPADRADFLELLIQLQDLAAEAKRRGLLSGARKPEATANAGAPASTAAVPSAAPANAPAKAPAKAVPAAAASTRGDDWVDPEAAKALFASLDDAG